MHNISIRHNSTSWNCSCVSCWGEKYDVNMPFSIALIYWFKWVVVHSRYFSSRPFKVVLVAFPPPLTTCAYFCISLPSEVLYEYSCLPPCLVAALGPGRVWWVFGSNQYSSSLCKAQASSKDLVDASHGHLLLSPVLGRRIHHPQLTFVT